MNGESYDISFVCCLGPEPIGTEPEPKKRKTFRRSTATLTTEQFVTRCRIALQLEALQLIKDPKIKRDPKMTKDPF